MKEKLARNIAELERIVAFTDLFFETEKLDTTIRFAVDLCIEELFVNMVNYNTETTQEILLELAPWGSGVEVSLTDFDVEKFDPTNAAAVNIDAPLEERTPHGLGLYLVIKMADSIHYQYRNRESKISFRKEGEHAHV